MTGHLTYAGTICQNSVSDCCPDVRRVGEAVQQLRIDLGDGV